MVKRKDHLFIGHWALPGGFVGIDESLEEGVRRELKEETNVENIYMEQLYTWEDVDRDPRMRKISVSYMALIDSSLVNKAEYTSIVFNLMPPLFTLSELQQVYEVILGKKLFKANFRRKISPMVEETDLYKKEGQHRPAKLYKFNLNWARSLPSSRSGR